MYRSLLPAGSRLRMCGYVMRKCVIVLALLGGAPLAGAATPTANVPSAKQVGIVTILEGRATVIRGLSQFDALQGVRLLPDDLVRTEESTFLRVEYADQTWMELGPETLLQLNHPAQKKRANRPGLYLLAGWLKLECKSDAAASRSLASKDMDLVDLSGVVVIRAVGGSHAIFEEHGTARWINRGMRGAAPITLNAGDFLRIGQGQPASVQARPAADFLAALPRAYLDTLPYRYSLFEARAVVPKDQRAISYADAEPWINAEAPVRRQFVVLWRRKALEPAFRESLDRDLAMHPEWDPVLHPEKYEISEPTQTGPQAGPQTVPRTGPPGGEAPSAPQPPPEPPHTSVPRSH
jgi:hypothetical protein